MKMEGKTRSRNYSMKELETLVSSLMERRELALGKYEGKFSTQNSVQQEWEAVAHEVNACGSGCKRSATDIKTKWKDLKHRTKKKHTKLITHREATGGGPSSALHDLSDLEKKVLSLMGNTWTEGSSPPIVDLGRQKFLALNSHKEVGNAEPSSSGIESETDEDWTERFIQSVQGKPPIYNTGLPQHANRTLVNQLWNQVGEEMVPNWKEMNSKEKSIKGKELQSRWRNLHTCFQRELNEQKQATSLQPSIKRRKYVYFDRLLFLLPTIKSTRCSLFAAIGDNLETEENPETVKTSGHLQTDALNKISSEGASIKKLVKPTTKLLKIKTKKIPNYGEPLLPILREKKEEQIDEDKYFLLSLVPTFKKLNDVEKLEAKMEFLAILKRLSQKHSHNEGQRQESSSHCTPQDYSENYVLPENLQFYAEALEELSSGSSTPPGNDRLFLNE